MKKLAKKVKGLVREIVSEGISDGDMVNKGVEGISDVTHAMGGEVILCDTYTSHTCGNRKGTPEGYMVVAVGEEHYTITLSVKYGYEVRIAGSDTSMKISA